MHSLVRGLHWLSCLCFFVVACGSLSSVSAQQSGPPERTEIVYFIGEVFEISGTLASISLGDVHTLNLVEPATQKAAEVALFRSEGPILRPLGKVPVRYVEATFSQISTRGPVKPQRGDIVMYVRELKELRNGPAHEDHSLRRAVLERKSAKRRTSVERSDMAHLLGAYKEAYPKWEQSQGDVAGYFFGRPRDTLTDELKLLTDQIDMLRKYHSEGFVSIAAAGQRWQDAMDVLLGEDAVTKHEAAASVKDESDGVAIDLLKLDRSVKDVFFDFNEEERAVASALAATALRIQPRNLDDWLITRFPSTQYPHWVKDPTVASRIGRVIEAMNRFD